MYVYCRVWSGFLPLGREGGVGGLSLKGGGGGERGTKGRGRGRGRVGVYCRAGEV